MSLSTMAALPRRPMGRQLIQDKQQIPSPIARREVSRLAREFHAQPRPAGGQDFLVMVARRLEMGRAAALTLIAGRLVEVETAYESLRLSIQCGLRDAATDGEQVWGDLR